MIWVNITLISYYWVNIFPNIFSLINDYPLEMLRFTSIRERSTFFSEPQLFKLRFTHSSECHSNTFTFLGKRLPSWVNVYLRIRYLKHPVAYTNQRPHVQLDMVMTSDKETTLSSDPDNSFKLPSCGGQFEVGLLGLY